MTLLEVLLTDGDTGHYIKTVTAEQFRLDILELLAEAADEYYLRTEFQGTSVFSEIQRTYRYYK